MFALAIALPLLLPVVAAADVPHKKVLILYSDDESFPAHVIIDQAISSTLKRNSPGTLEIYHEALQSLRIPTDKYESEFVAMLRRKYENERIDLLIPISGPALLFLLKHRNEIFPGSATLFILQDQSRVAGVTQGVNITGVWGKLELTPTLDMALALHPETQRVAVVIGEGSVGNFMLSKAQKEFAPYAGKVEFTYLSKLTFEELRQTVAAQPPKTIIIYLSFSVDTEGKTLSAPDQIAQIAPSANVPIYVVGETHFGPGVVGGHLQSFEALGARAGELALRILAGQRADDITPETVESVTMVDWRQLRRWGIDESKLPAGSIVRFKEPSFWEQYKWRIVGVISLCVLEAFLIVLLWISRNRRREAERESKRLAEVAEAERQHLDEVVSNVPGVVWESRLEPGTNARKVHFVSDYVEKMLGYNKKEWSTPGFALTIVPEEDRERLLRETDAILENGKQGTLQFRWTAKDGSLLWVEAHVNAVCDASGKPVGLRGVTMDITERRRAEEALRLSESRFRTMADSAPVMIWLAGSDMLRTYFNRGWLEFTGRTVENELGTGWTERVHKDDYARCLETCCSAFDRREPFRMEYRLKRADGAYRWIYDTGTPRFKSTGEFLGYIGSCIDIADRKEAEEALQTAHQEVSQLKNQLEAENIYLQEEIKLAHNVDEIVGHSDAIKYVLFKIQQVAKTDTTVLILGETGTGKELVARALHSQSQRKDRPFVKVNCAALSASLIESELFGHEKGAFTGASARKIGRFELADGATIFLDEIGELPLDLQPKLLRVLQEGELERLGSTKTLKVNVRIIAATNRNMTLEIQKGRFREDLWYRLNVFPITVPPLRQRKEDIPPMVEHFAALFSKKIGKVITSISAATLRKFHDYSWPGNIRELSNVIERGVINAQGPVLHVTDQFARTETTASIDSNPTLEEVERSHISRVLDQTGWRIEGPNGAAKVLGLNPSTLRTRMLKLGIQKDGRSLTAKAEHTS